MSNSITKKLATSALTETIRVAWQLIYGGRGVIEAWATDQGALEDRTVPHWFVLRLMGLCELAVHAGECLEKMVDKATQKLGIDLADVLTGRVDHRMS